MKILISSITDANVRSIDELKYLLDNINYWHQVASIDYHIKGYTEFITIYADACLNLSGTIVIKCSPFDPDVEYELKEDEAYAKD